MSGFPKVVCATAFVFAMTQFAIAGDQLQAGVGVEDITPPVPFRMAGYFSERLSTGAKDPLRAKAVVFQQGDQSAALVVCDLVGISREISSAARRQASDATGIPVEHIAVAATHSHTGPLYFGALHDYFHERSATKLGNDPHDSSDYRQELVSKIASAIVKAKSALEPVTLTSGYAVEERLSFNRRFHMKDGSVRFNPALLDPNVVRPAGPIDPQVGIVLLHKANADVAVAAIVSFAMHLDTVGGTEYSADYPRFVEDRLKNALGPEFTLLFGAGTCGDINHRDVKTSDTRRTDAIGAMLGDIVEKVIESNTLSPTGEPSLAVRSMLVQAPLQSYSDSEVEEARKNMALIGTRELSFIGQVEAYKIIDVQRRKRDGDALALEVQVFRLNRETAIVTLPAEIFVEIGLAIKAASPFKTTLVVELANDSLGYIPTKKAFAEGSYEIVNSRVEPGSGERLVEAAVGLLEALK